jgi:arylsulfatase I/J
MMSLFAVVACEEWVRPHTFSIGHNGGIKEKLIPPVAGKQPHILMILLDDYGWATAGWHRNYSIGGLKIPATTEVQTPELDALVLEGIELDRAYVYKCCCPTRSAIQSGRSPYHVNPLNSAAEISNRDDPVSGFAAIPRNMTGIATKMAAAGYATAMFGKWDAVECGCFWGAHCAGKLFSFAENS